MTTVPPVTLIRKLKLSDLEAATYNPRKIDAEALQGLKDSLSSYSLLEMPIVNVRGGKRRLVGGHQRVTAMLAEGVVHADCVVVDYDDTTEKLANLTLNNPALQGTFDPTASLPEIEKVMGMIPKPDHARFDALMSEVRAQTERMGKAEVKKQAQEAAPATPVTPVSKLNTLYRIGPHRMWCGDSLVGIAKMLGKKRAHACVTDPPYAVAYESAAGESIENDDLAGEEWQKFVDDFCKVIVTHTDGPCYVFMASKEIPALQEGWERAGGLVQQWLIWAKDRFTLSRGDYHHQYEPALFGWRNNVVPKLVGKSRTNVLEYPKPASNPLHPCLRPGSLVLTATGWQPIDTVSVGDLLLTADGTFHEAVDVSHHYGPDHLYRLRVEGVDAQVDATGNHPFLVCHDGVVAWVEASQLSVGDYLLTPLDLRVAHGTQKPCDVMSPGKATVADGMEPAAEWNTLSCGKLLTALCQSDTKSTIGTKTSRTIDCSTSNFSTPLRTSGCTPVASCEMGSGGSPVGCVVRSSPLPQSIGTCPVGGLMGGCADFVSVEKCAVKNRFALHRVVSVESITYAGEVWNLTVEGSPTFQTQVGMSHNTQKPIELIRDLVADCTEPGQLVIDPFLGSGTTLAACVETGRIGYGCELSPVFMDRIRKRIAEQIHGEGCDWQSLTAPA